MLCQCNELAHIACAFLLCGTVQQLRRRALKEGLGRELSKVHPSRSSGITSSTAPLVRKLRAFWAACSTFVLRNPTMSAADSRRPPKFSRRAETA